MAETYPSQENCRARNLICNLSNFVTRNVDEALSPVQCLVLGSSEDRVAPRIALPRIPARERDSRAPSGQVADQSASAQSAPSYRRRLHVVADFQCPRAIWGDDFKNRGGATFSKRGAKGPPCAFAVTPSLCNLYVFVVDFDFVCHDASLRSLASLFAGSYQINFWVLVPGEICTQRLADTIASLRFAPVGMTIHL